MQSLAVAAGAYLFGYLLVNAAVGGRPVGRLMRAALAAPAFVAYSLVLMLLHMATGGLVLSNPSVVRAVTLTVAAALTFMLWRRRAEARRGSIAWSHAACVALVIAAALVLWWAPVGEVLPLHFKPDTNLHMGWATQLMNGETSPSSVVTGDVPNYYPWLYHGLVALLASFAGEHAFQALGPLQVLLVMGTGVAFVALGRELTGLMSGGVAAAVFGALTGGFGIGLLFDRDVAGRISDYAGIPVPWLGDVLLRRPYNFGFNNLAPPYPRDLSFMLLVVFLLLLVVGLKRRSAFALASAGVTLGLIGLAGGEAFILAAGSGLISCIATREPGRIRRVLLLLVPAVLIYAAWLLPAIVSYIRFEGLVNTTHVDAVILDPPFVLLSWGIALPFALAGAVLLVPRFLVSPAARIPVSLILAASALMLTDAIPALFGDAFLTLGRDHRYWSLFHLGVALLAAIGASHLWERAWRAKPLAITGALLVLILGCAAPLYAGLLYTDANPPDELIGDTLRGERTILRAMAPTPGDRCVVAVPGNRLARQVFAYTGYRMVLWAAGQREENWARIRWRELARTVSRDQERLTDNRLLTKGGDPEDWSRVADRYEVDQVIVYDRAADSPAFAGLPMESFELGDRSANLVTVQPCGSDEPHVSSTTNP